MRRRLAMASVVCLLGLAAIIIGRFDNGSVFLRRTFVYDVPAVVLLAVASYVAVWCGTSPARFIVRLTAFLLGTCALYLIARWTLPRMYYRYYVDVGTIHAVLAALVCLAIHAFASGSWRQLLGRLWMRDFFILLAAVGGLLFVCDWMGVSIDWDPKRWDLVLMLRGVGYSMVPVMSYVAVRFCQRLPIRLLILATTWISVGMVASHAADIVRRQPVVYIYMSATAVASDDLWYVCVAVSQGLLLLTLMIAVWAPLRPVDQSEDLR